MDVYCLFGKRILKNIKERLDHFKSEGQSVYFYQDMFNKRIQKNIELNFGLQKGEVNQLLISFNPAVALTLSTGEKIYKAQ